MSDVNPLLPSMLNFQFLQENLWEGRRLDKGILLEECLNDSFSQGYLFYFI